MQAADPSFVCRRRDAPRTRRFLNADNDFRISEVGCRQQYSVSQSRPECLAQGAAAVTLLLAQTNSRHEFCAMLQCESCRDLALITRQGFQLGVCGDADVVFVERAAANAGTPVHGRAGGRFPVTATALRGWLCLPTPRQSRDSALARSFVKPSEPTAV